MRGYSYIKQRQRLWGLRRGLTLIHPPDSKGEAAYTQTVNENLFEPLGEAARVEFGSGDGNELGKDGRPGKIQAVHSSSAIGCNFFHYWQRTGDAGPIATALRLPKPEVANSIEFEAKRPVMETANPKEFPNSPNLDVVIGYGPGADVAEVGIECKFSEAYGGYRHGGLRQPYLDHHELWEGLDKTRKLAEEIRPNHERFKRLHAAQLIKHILGLKHRASRTGFYLLYLWYDVPGEDGARHQKEIDEFREVVRADGVRFRAMTYQELILALADRCRDEHRDYVDYLAERYL